MLKWERVNERARASEREIERKKNPRDLRQRDPTRLLRVSLISIRDTNRSDSAEFAYISALRENEPYVYDNATTDAEPLGFFLPPSRACVLRLKASSRDSCQIASKLCLRTYAYRFTRECPSRSCESHALSFFPSPLSSPPLPARSPTPSRASSHLAARAHKITRSR